MRVALRLRGTTVRDRAPRGARIMSTDNDCGFSLVTGTWLTGSLLKPLTFRPKSRIQSPNSDILVDFGVPNGVETAQNATPCCRQR